MEKLRLANRSKFTVRLNTAIFIVLLLVAFAAGVAVQRYAGLVKQEACIPQAEFKYFLDRANVVQAEYQKCVQDLWSLSYTCKQATAKPANTTVVKTNTTAVNASK